MRRENDFYPTPEWATRELLKRLPVISGVVMEPCVGVGDMARVLVDAPGVANVLTNDVDTSRPAMSHADATDGFWWRRQVCDWVVTNPPFCDADRIIPLAVKHAGRGVAALLRLTFLEPCEGRGAWLAEHPPTDLIVLPRISFTGDGNTDSVTCAWMVWDVSAASTIQIVNPVDERQGSLLESA